MSARAVCNLNIYIQWATRSTFPFFVIIKKKIHPVVCQVQSETFKLCVRDKQALVSLSNPPWLTFLYASRCSPMTTKGGTRLTAAEMEFTWGPEVLTAVIMKMYVFWLTRPCSPLTMNLCLWRGTHRLHLKGRRINQETDQREAGRK
jgi:hypothetical protein